MRSWLYCPGNSPKMIISAPLYGADGLVLDLEDSVADDRKGEARQLVAQAFAEGIVSAESAAVRINGPDTGLWVKDLEELIPAGVRMIRVPKTEDPEGIREICAALGRIERENGIEAETVTLQCILETPLGVENAFALGGSSPRIRSYSFGAEDYCAAVGISRGRELFPLDYPRSRIASAAASFGYGACDTVWGFLDDPEGLAADARRAAQLGFEGKSLIHPDQIETVNRIFSPSGEELSKARRILDAAAVMNGGAAAAEGRMIDRPVILRAEKVLRAAGRTDLLKKKPLGQDP